MTEPTNTEPSNSSRRARRAALARPSISTPGRLVVIVGVLVLALVGVVAQVTLSGPESSAAPSMAIDAVPNGRAIDNAWFCAEGTSNPGGRADETIVIANRGTSAADVTVEVNVEGAPQSRDYSVAPDAQQRVRVAEIAASAEPGVTVYSRGGQVVVEHAVVGSDDVALGPCARRSAAEWNFAAGTTVKGAFEWLSLYNPYPEGALVDIDVLTQDVKGDVTVDRQVDRIESVNIPGRTRRTIAVHERIGRYAATALNVRARYGRVVAERSLVFNDVEGRKGLAVSLGAPGLATQFVFPDSRAAEGRAEVLAVANPGTAPAQVKIRPLFDGGISIEPIELTVNAKTVANVVTPAAPKDLRRVLVVDSSSPVVVELRVTTAKPQPASGIATMVGETTTAKQWTFAAAQLNATSVDKYRVYNPGSKAARMRTRILGPRPQDGPEFEIAAGGTVLVDAKELKATPAGALIFDADRPVVIARVTDATGITISAGLPAS